MVFWVVYLPKALEPIERSPEPKTTDFRALLPVKAFVPIDFTELGISRYSMLLPLQRKLPGMVVTLLPIDKY